MNNKKSIHSWLNTNPECLKIIESFATLLNEETREQVYQLLADYWRWGAYPKDELTNKSSPEVKYITTHLIYYIQFIMGERTKLPKQ